MTQASALSPGARDQALTALAATPTDGELDVLVVGGGIVGAGTALDAVTRGLSTGLIEQRDLASGTSSRSSKLIHGGLRYLEMFDFGLVREALEERGLLLTRLAPHLVKPVPFLYPLHHTLGAAVRRGRARAVRRDGDGGQVRHGRAEARAPVPQARRPDRPRPAHRGPQGRHPLLRRPGRRRPPGADRRTYGGQSRRARRDPDARDRLRPRGRAGRRGAGRRPRVRPRDRGTGQGRRERRRRLDRRDPGDGRRSRRPARPGQQGHPPRGAARPDPVRGGVHRPHRDLGAVRDPVGPALDHRHHRHRLEPRQGPPGRIAGGHRLPARPREHAVARAARPRRRRGRLRRPPAPRHRRPRADVADLPRAHRRRARARPGDDRRRQAARPTG